MKEQKKTDLKPMTSLSLPQLDASIIHRPLGYIHLLGLALFKQPASLVIIHGQTEKGITLWVLLRHRGGDLLAVDDTV